MNTLDHHTYPVLRSLAHRVCECLRRGHATALVTGQIADRFGVPARDVGAFLDGAVRHQWLKRESIGAQQHLYSPGRALVALQQASAATPSPAPVPMAAAACHAGRINANEAAAVSQFITSQADVLRQPHAPKPEAAVQAPAPEPAAPPAPPPARRRRDKQRVFDASQLLVRRGMPTPKRGGQRSGFDYAAMFEVLSEPEISADFAIAHIAGVRRAVHDRRGTHPEQRYAVGMAHDDDSKGRIKRLA